MKPKTKRSGKTIKSKEIVSSTYSLKRNQENSKNVILVTLDALNFNLFIDNLESLPNLKKLKERGVFFQNAFSIGPETHFSFPGIIGGVYPYSFGVGIDKNIKTIDEILAENGYNTALINESNALLTPFYGYGKNIGYSKHFLEASPLERDRKLKDTFLKRTGNTPTVGPSHARDYLEKVDLHHRLFKKVKKRQFRYFRNIYRFIRLYLSDNTENFQERKKLHERFQNEITKFINKYFKTPQFLWIHTMVNHLPYLPPSDGVFEERKINYLNYRGLSRFINRACVRELKSLYVESLKTADRLIGNIIIALEVSKYLDNSVIIMTADHGEEFMEEGFFGHLRESSSDELLHVPLLFYCPRMFKSDIVSLPISTMDILPTVTDLLNLKKPDNARGISLIKALKNPDDPKERGRFWRRPIYSEAWEENPLDRAPGYRSSKRIFTVRKGKYKLRVRQELKKHMRTLTENYHLVNWVDNDELDIQKNYLIFEELHRLLYEHIYEKKSFRQHICQMPERREEEEKIKERLRALGYL